MIKKSCFIEITYEGGSAGAWAITPVTHAAVLARIEELIAPTYSGSKQLTPPKKVTRVFLHVEVKDGHHTAFAQGTDGYPQVEARALELLKRAQANWQELHGGIDTPQEKRAIQL